MTTDASGPSSTSAPTSLPPVPDDFAAEREDYHRLAYAVVSEARRQVTNRIGLRSTEGGFGTPPFGEAEQVIVAGTTLTHRSGAVEKATPITTLDAAGKFVGVTPTDSQAEHDTVPLGATDRPLQVSDATGALLGLWFEFGTTVLQAVLTRATAQDNPAEIQLWPGHFDAATEIGSADDGHRATYGASPDDAAHVEPYLYIGAWGEVDLAQPFWNAEAFTGASLSYQQLLAAPDPRATADTFFRTGYQLLHGA